MKMFNGVFQLSIMFLVTLEYTSCKVYHIVPSNDHPCTGSSCLTLSQITKNKSSEYYIESDSNTTLVIVDGNHTLSNSIAVSNTEHLSMFSTRISTAIINCNAAANFTISNVSHVYISGLTFIGCGNNKVVFVNNLIIENTKFLGHKISGSSIIIVCSCVQLTKSLISNALGRQESDGRYLNYLQTISLINYKQYSNITIGGALFVTNSTLNIDNCIFDGNRANMGGAIFSDLESNITISNSEFTSNQATGCDEVLCFGSGGALFVGGSSIAIVCNSTFYNNTSSGDGGVATVFFATLSILESHAYSNRAMKNGGVVASFLSSYVYMDTAIVSNNIANYNGGVIANTKKTTTFIIRSNFSNNSVGYTGKTVGDKINTNVISIRKCNSATGNGGVLYIESNSSVTVKATIFVNNSATGNGGVLHVQKESYLAIINCTILKSNAMSGGVIYAVENTSVSISTNCYFDGNVANFDGGVVFLEKFSNISINMSIFNESETKKSCGGVIFAQADSLITISDTTFTFNKAKTFGGVVCMRHNSSMLVNDSWFDHNSAGNNGGVVDCFFGTNIKMYRSSFTNNMAKLKGGVLIMTNENGNGDSNDIGVTEINEVINCTFTQNSAPNGGVLALQTKCTMNIHYSTFINNTAKVDGGTLYAQVRCIITVINCSFNGNTAINNGILLASYNCVIVMYGSRFINNNAGFNGGVVYILDKCNMTIKDCKFIRNQANDSGGTIYVRKSSLITISYTTFNHSTALNSGGVVHVQRNSTVHISISNFTSNIADYGGAVHAYDKSNANIIKCNFNENRASISGGVLAIYKGSSIAVQDSSFVRNSANVGGVLIVFQTALQDRYSVRNVPNFGCIHGMRGSSLAINTSVFRNNSAKYGGVLYVQGSTASIKGSTFDWNTARVSGGVILVTNNSTITLDMNNISNSAAKKSGGVMSLTDGSIVDINYCIFTSNNVQTKGGAFNIQESNANITSCRFNSSTAERGTGGAIYASNSTLQIEHSLFINNIVGSNGGAMHIEQNTTLVILSCNFTNNIAQYYGGALFLAENSHSTVINGILQHNEADIGGALAALSTCSIYFKSYSHANLYKREAVINYNDHVTQVKNNIAHISGGGIYLNGTSLHFTAETNICYNQAGKFGGGIHAILSSIKFGSKVQFDSNTAGKGGAISLSNSELYNIEYFKSAVSFIFNKASNGGALYVDDSTFCSVYSPTFRGCFFQHVTKDLMINFDNNLATCTGDDLYGGLLDRCTIIESDSNVDSISHWKVISNLTSLNTISSQPAKVCHCNNHKPDCDKKIYSRQIKQGDKFKISVVVVDQVKQPVSASVVSILNTSNAAFPRNQSLQRIDASCYDLEYNISFPTAGQTHELTIDVNNHPCNDNYTFSKIIVLVDVIECSCAPGFMPAAGLTTECYCLCDKQDKTFSKYIQTCDSENGTVLREGIFWITYLKGSENNNSSGYLFFPYCPLEYCQPPGRSIHVNLSQPNGSDAQCTNHRIGILCGSCPLNHSLSLGSAKCIECPDNWHGLLVVIFIAAFLAGIVLVLSLLVFNLTVAVGTLNSIVFYANIIYANKSVYFGHSHFQVITSWLNLDIGFDTCFFDGMDTYAKTWLQLAFPMYIIALVIVIILISSRSSRFSTLIGKKDPVATLATLILLSYTKLLQTVITSSSYVKVEYPDGTSTVRWVRDANIEFGTGKSIALICVALIILFLGLLYTVLVLSWQCLVKCPRSRLLSWTRSHKLYSFINTYHIPHTAKHRYWPGLLLLVRVLVYLIAAFSASSDQPITLLSTVIIMCCLLFYKTHLVIQVYRNWLLNTMESFVYFNIAVFAVFTMFTFNNNSINGSKDTIQKIVSNISIGSTLLLILFVIVFHVYRYGNAKVYTFVGSTNLCKLLKTYDQNHRQWTQSDNTLLDFIDNPRVESDIDYIPSSLVLPTISIVSMTNTEETSVSMSSLNQSTNQSLSSFQDHNKSHEEVQNRSRPTVKSLITKRNSLEMSKFGNTQKAVSKSFTSQKPSSIMKPLLKEDKLSQ